MRFIIDTNVPIAANGRNTHASEECQLRCVNLLSDLAVGRKSVVVLDSLDLIFQEYSVHLHYHGQPGVGDLFFKYLHDNMHMQKLVRLVSISPNQDESSGFDELPTNTVDKSDRKFLATALVSGATIVNALDTDWAEQKVFLDKLDVKVCQLCPEQGCPAQ